MTTISNPKLQEQLPVRTTAMLPDLVLRSPEANWNRFLRWGTGYDALMYGAAVVACPLLTNLQYGMLYAA